MLIACPDTGQATQLATNFEGYSAGAYRDIGGVPTIGFGHTGPDVHLGLIWTRDQALAALTTDMATARNAVWNAVADVGTNTDQLAAMTDLAFNIGVTNFRSSSVLRFHRAVQYDGAANAFLLWDKAHVDGQLVEVNGLLRRRHAERLLYLSQDWQSVCA